MNERIKELSEMSGFHFDEYNEATARKIAILGTLIVRECIDIISPYAVRMENFDGGHPIKDLQSHFGVDE